MRQAGGRILCCSAGLCAFFGLSGQAVAQDGEEEYVDDAPEVPMGDPLEEDYGAEAPPQRRHSLTYRRKAEERDTGGLVLAVEGGAPVWVDVPALDPGVDVALRVGYDFGGIAPDVTLGFMSNRVNDEVALVVPEVVGRDLQHIQLGLGLRGLWVNRTRYRPFLSVGFDFNFWTWTGNTELQCDVYYYYCAESQNYELVPGINTRLGLLTRIVDPFHVEVGGKFHLNFAGSLFGQTQFWLGPYLGVVFE